jgi:hypothetical protein
MLRVLRGYFPAVLLGYLVAVVIGTLSLMGTVAGFGIEVTSGDRLAAIWHDLIGMAPTYLPLLAIAFAIAFLVSALLIRWLSLPRAVLYAVGGFVAVIALHLIMEMTLGLVGIAAARTVTGLLGQALAGAMAGVCFAVLSHRPHRHP